MSFVANPHNNFPSAPISESDNDDENDYESSLNRQNESMMHKVKDAVSKFLHPSFLFSASDETDRSKRKRSTSVEESDAEQQSGTATTTGSKYQRQLISNNDNEQQLTDDEDNNSQDVPSTEDGVSEIAQQKKRRRTANYQNILSTKTANDYYEDERTSSPLISTDGVRSLVNRRIDPTRTTTSVSVRTTTEQNRNEGMNKFASSKQRFNIPSTYRGSTSNYDPSQSPLFPAGSRKTTETSISPHRTTTNLKSYEFSANHLLATSLVTRPQSSPSNSQQSLATLTNPTTTNNNNRLLSNERQMLGVNYASINSRRLPYIERLRRRTLQDCIRLNRTLDNEPLSMSTIEEHTSSAASPIPKRTKAPEKECGIQCDISTEPSKKVQRTFPPSNIRNEALTVPAIEKIQSSSQTDSSMQTNSSITIDNVQPAPPINITKPKVLGTIAPFSWPKFARSQEEYAKKYPEKCRADAPVVAKSNVNVIPAMYQQTNSSSTISKMPVFSSSPLRPAKPTSEAIWQCPSCTKEHPAQTASCSLCHGINQNYKRLSTDEPKVAREKESVPRTPPSKLPDFTFKEPNISTSTTTTTTTNQTVTPSTTTKENVLSTPPPVTTSASSINFPPLSTASFPSFPVINQENPVSTSVTFPSSSLFGAVPIVSLPSTTKEHFPFIPPPVTTSAPATTGVNISLFGSTAFTSTLPTTKENPVSTAAAPLFGTTTTTNKENPVSSRAPFTFAAPPSGNAASTVPLPSTTKENPVTSISSFTSGASPAFGTSTWDKSLTTSASNSYQVGTTMPSFGLPPSTSFTTAATSSAVPSVSLMTPGIVTSPPQVSRSVTFGGAPIPTANSAVPLISSDNPVLFSFGTNTSALSSSTASPNTFASSTFTSTFGAAPVSSFPAASTASAFSSPNSFTFTSTAAPTFGTSGLPVPGFSFSPDTTTTTPSNPPFPFGLGSSLRPSVSNMISSTHSNSAPTFGSVSSFSPFGLSNAPSLFGLGSPSNPITNIAGTPAAPGGFQFRPAASTVPGFGASSSTFSQSGSPPLFNFSVPAGGSTNSIPFQFQVNASAPTTNNLFPPPSFPGSTAESNPFDISSEESTPASRPKIRAKRRFVS